MGVPEILEKAKDVLLSKADKPGQVTPGAIADALRAVSDGDGKGFNVALTYVAAGMEANGVPNAHRFLNGDYTTPLPLSEAQWYLNHAIETWRIAKK